MNKTILQQYPNADWLFLYTLAHVLPAGRFSLSQWNQAVSTLAGRRVFLPSYRALSAYLEEKILGR